MFGNKIKKLIFGILLGLVVINPSLVVAQTTSSSTPNIPAYTGVQGSISSYLCTPSETGDDSHALENCVNKLYRFGIAAGAISLVFFLVFAGYMYMTGGETGKAKGKSILQNALVGMGLLLGSYLILSFINPSLTIFRPIQPPIFDAAAPASCEDVGLGKNCVLPDDEGGTPNAVGRGTAAPCSGGAGGLIAIPAALPHTGSVTHICKDLADKLLQVVKLLPPTGVNAWTISQTYSDSTPSKSRCHHTFGTIVNGIKATETGNCADLIMVGQKSGTWPSDKHYGNLCKAVKQVGGLNYLNESSTDADCAPYDDHTPRTGANLHTNFIGG